LTLAAGWRLERQHGPAQQLHQGSAAGIEEGAVPVRTVRVLAVERPALVLGSSQPASDVDEAAADRAGVDVVRRRSGGGAVLVDRSVVWVDLIVPATDPLWDADVGRATWWVGRAWAAALEEVGAGPAEVWHGPMRATAWSSRVCFGGLGPGEVVARSRKVVGISQRRTRHAALFQTAAALVWDPAAILGLLRLDPAERARGIEQLDDAAGGVPLDGTDGLLSALLAALP
jgi:lipoate-protein ligase A